MNMRRLALFTGMILLSLGLQGADLAAPKGLPKANSKRDLGPNPTAKTTLNPFNAAPFPYRGQVPGKDKPFLDVIEGERLGHSSARADTTYWEDQTYSDRRVLLHIPRGFDPRRPALIVVFLHGNEATLTRDVRNRQQVPRQVSESGLNAVLVAPQFAVNALDSSAGRFWEAGGFAQFVQEAAERLTELYGDERAREAFFGAPLVLAGYSGGYHPAAFILQRGHVDERVRGLILLDAPFGDHEKFVEWLGRRPPAFFVSAFGKAAEDDNVLLKRMLKERGLRYQTSLPGSLARGTIAFISAPEEVNHADFVTEAWVRDPLKVILRRIPGFSRSGALR
ncbi:MAG: alpha/beta hydrolase [Xanthobacteraceae bacterium]